MLTNGSSDGLRGYLLLTGSTGSIGHYVLAELLRRGRPCVLLLRAPVERSQQRLADLMSDLGFDVPALVEAGQLVAMEGDLTQSDWPAPPRPIEAVIHAAASTQFEASATGEPARTNADGTLHLLAWMTRHRIDQLHLVSSAYVCGKTNQPVAETRTSTPPAFHNAYEQSKWTSEQHCARWAAEGDCTLTTYRPSVVVGDEAAGRSTKFSGFYLCTRATELLSRAYEDAGNEVRHAIPLRLRGDENDCQNIVPVDYVAAMMAAIVTNPAWHGRVYHLTHPAPPSNGQIKAALETFFDIDGGRFVPPATLDDAQLNEYERLFWDVSRPIEHYYIDTPVFLRPNAAEVEAATGIRCRPYNRAALTRLLHYAVHSCWGRRNAYAATEESSGCAAYFESFLPEHVGHSQVAQMSGLTVAIRFIIEDEPNGQWLCRFEGGQLVDVVRGLNGVREDFAYRCRRDVFWEAVSGQVHPQELFLTGRAEIVGDVEQAMKMAMVLNAFNREFPCDQQRLLAEVAS